MSAAAGLKITLGRRRPEDLFGSWGFVHGGLGKSFSGLDTLEIKAADHLLPCGCFAWRAELRWP